MGMYNQYFNNTDTSDSTEAVTPEETTVNEAEETTVKEATEEQLALAEYLANTEVNPGLIASFKAETLNDTETPRTEKQWKKDFEIQSNRLYV